MWQVRQLQRPRQRSKANFEIGEEKTEASEKVEEGRIIRTDPGAGTGRKKERKSIWLSHQANNPSKLVIMSAGNLLMLSRN